MHLPESVHVPDFAPNGANHPDGAEGGAQRPGRASARDAEYLRKGKGE